MVSDGKRKRNIEVVYLTKGITLNIYKVCKQNYELPLKFCLILIYKFPMIKQL